MTKTGVIKKVAVSVFAAAICGLMFVVGIPAGKAQWRLADARGHFDSNAFDVEWYFEHVWNYGIWYFLAGFGTGLLVAGIWVFIDYLIKVLRPNISDPTTEA